MDFSYNTGGVYILLSTVFESFFLKNGYSQKLTRELFRCVPVSCIFQ